MTATILARRTLLLTPLAGLALAGCTPQAEPAATTPPAPATPEGPVGRVVIRRHQVAFMGNVMWGRGTLTFGNQTRIFRLRGLGAGGMGFSRMDATGDVFNLRRLEDFPGVYGQVRSGIVAGDAQVRGFVWLQNTNGVRIRLAPRRRGLALQFGADGILVEFAPEPAAAR